MNWAEQPLLSVALFAAVFFLCVPPLAADEIRPYSSMVVQNRVHSPTHEFTLGLGLLPQDAFTKGVTVSGSYTLHFSERWAWEVAHFYYSFPWETRLRDELRALDVQPTPFEIVEYYLASSVVYKPLYWKGSWLNSRLAHGEFFFDAGGAYAWYTRSNRPGLSVGAGARVYVTRRLSFRFDTRYLVFFDSKFLDDFQYKDEVSLVLGTSIGF